ncbi:MAG TPA: hypothetical protein ENK75_04755 [Saprospiraceae bacterium]|nr:hypothetical protein [Saprospiraceae bacterium]
MECDAPSILTKGRMYRGAMPRVIPTNEELYRGDGILTDRERVCLKKDFASDSKANSFHLIKKINQ